MPGFVPARRARCGMPRGSGRPGQERAQRGRYRMRRVLGQQLAGRQAGARRAGRPSRPDLERRGPGRPLPGPAPQHERRAGQPAPAARSRAWCSWCSWSCAAAAR
ncbi:hypothetical protein GQR88_24465 [Burkholderia glumae AU6208]|nr:hypothetical protein GQR88_24465 [Burkholderia glumae AU6208]